MNSFWDLSHIAAILQGTSSTPTGRGVGVGGVSTDSRTIQKGELFFAIAGPNFDGHRFVPQAFERGACAAVVARPAKYPGPVIEVRNPRAALGILAAAWRKKIPAKVIGVTGTNGKTTTKDMIAHILSKKFRVVRAEKSFNNDIGVPQTLLRAREEDRFVVLEIGTNHPGEIHNLGQIASPDVAVITVISEAHLEGLKTVEAVADEKFSLLHCLTDEGLAVLNADNEWIYERLTRIKQRKKTFGIAREADLMASGIRTAPDEIAFTVQDVPFTLRMRGRWNVLNTLAATTVGMETGLSLRECADALTDFRPPAMRMEKIVRGGVTFLCDAYNANPVSLRNALQELAETAWAGRKVAVIGDMLELGEHSARLHRELGEWLARVKSIEVVVTVGRESKQIVEALKTCRGNLPGRPVSAFESGESAKKKLPGLLRPGDLVLVKGSRAMALEKLMEAVS